MKRKTKGELAKELDIASAIGGLIKEKSIPQDLVLESLKEALASAAKRYLGTPINVEVIIDKETGGIEVYGRRTVVEEVTDPEKEIGFEEAKAIDSELEVGDELIEDLDIEMFGRTAIQTAKQVVVQRVRDAERDKIFQDYSDRIGELITGTVQQIDKGNILVNLGRTEALLPYREQIRKERFRQGDTIRACITEVKVNSKGPQIIISRTCPDFLARLFELEVPEIFDKTVRIVKVARDPGHRSKIVVATSDERVDPVGACVGMRGNRVQAIVRELSNERIDIINWTSEPSLMVRRVFSPSEVKRVFEVGDNKVVIIIKEEDLAQAIGKEGQNIRLASRIIDKEIDVYGDEEYAAMSEEEREAALKEDVAEPEETGEAVPEAPAQAGETQVDDTSSELDTAAPEAGQQDAETPPETPEMDDEDQKSSSESQPDAEAGHDEASAEEKETPVTDNESGGHAPAAADLSAAGSDDDENREEKNDTESRETEALSDRENE
ncbi:MAG: transcription termination factor NusA [Chitinivibrionales bacterium]|nr:transcription termination factor NusA [Chitinivibrionales bacterium]